jgi:AAA+ superfamily predicted ATPase
MSAERLPEWAEKMRRIFRAGTTSQFVLHGNVFDLIPLPQGDGDSTSYVPLKRYLAEVMFGSFDVVIRYDRGRGIRVPRGADHFHRFLKIFDTFAGTRWAAMPRTRRGPAAVLDTPGLLPRDPKRAIELIDRFVRANLTRTVIQDGRQKKLPLKIAVIIDYAHFVLPHGDPLYISGDLSQILVQVLDWGSDPAITGAYVATVLITEALSDLNRLLVESPYSAKIEIKLPGVEELREYIEDLTEDVEDFSTLCDVDRDTLAAKLLGLSRVNVRNLVLRAQRNQERITFDYLTSVKKELIEKEAFGRLEFVETDRTLDDVAGHQEAKAWLRQDIKLLKKGLLRAIPMGYLIIGRIGTGKTFLTECFAGEVGVPCVQLKNFREKWVGATEGNLERIFNILHAIGQVVVFVDEADQAMGRRGGDGGGDSGLSGRIYAMMAKEMSDTRNRGKILWIFATSRPDLLEVDLKRQGRLDVHIPLFPPQDPESRQELFRAMARKVKAGIDPEELPPLPDNEQIGGNEMEGMLIRAVREYETQPPDQPRKSMREILERIIKEFRPSAHVERLEFMDLIAVKECTDERFLPPKYRELSIAEINARLAELKQILGEA